MPNDYPYRSTVGVGDKDAEEQWSPKKQVSYFS